VVHIARTDWPEKYPEFYNNVLMLVSSPNTSLTILGLLFLQTTSEELGTPRNDLLSSRKCELKSRLIQLVPQTLAILTGIQSFFSLFHFSVIQYFNSQQISF